MKKLIKLVLACSLFLYAFSSMAQANCSASLVTPVILPNGINVTSAFTGSVLNYANAFTSCVGTANPITTPANSTWLGSDNLNINYTLNFSQPVNNIFFNITATGQNNDEVFTFTTDAGNPTIIQNGGCFSGVAGNVIISGLNSAGVTGGGGQFLITAPNSFTQLTITGPGGQSGSLFSFCQNSILPACANNLTLISPDDDVNNSSLPTFSQRQATNMISASNVIGFGNNGPQVGVIYHAGGFVDLTPGFDAILTSQFEAYPQGCSNNFVYRNQNEVKNDDSNNLTKMTKGFSIQPNPSNDFINLNMGNGRFNTISVVSIDGKMILNKTMQSINSYIIDIRSFDLGMYVVTIISDEGQQFSQKLIKN